MQLHCTLNKFPSKGSLKDQCGLPFACVVQPFSQAEGCDVQAEVKAEELARCSTCYAYINAHCSFQAEGWTCALCGCFNELSNLKSRRYARSQSRRLLPELQGNFVEVQCAIEGDSDAAQEDQARTYELDVQPIYLALVDLSCNEEFLELVRSALLAALEAVPPTARFGLVTFSDKVGLYDMQGSVPAVRLVPLVEDGTDSPTPLDLQDALPLDALLASVASSKESIAAAVEGLQPDQPSVTEASLDLEANGSARPNATRGFGSALQAVLRYLGSGRLSLQPDGSAADGRPERTPKDPKPTGAAPLAAGHAYAGARLLAFLSGPANYGRGAVVRLTEVRPDSEEETEEEEDLPLYDPSFPDINPYSFPSRRRQQRPKNGVPNGHHLEFAFRPDKSAKAFYEEAAIAAASLGVCVEVYVASPSSCSLELMEPLASNSGGILHLYPTLEQAALPQDVYRRLSSPCALNGLLRVRTSPEFRVARSYGQLFPDERYDNLAHIVACNASTAFAFDFEYTSAAGFGASAGNPPLLQVAFQYSAVLPAETVSSSVEDGEAETAQQPQRYVLQRRLRIMTTRVKVARSAGEVYDGANADAILTMLMHKIGRAANSEGPQEARGLLQDWLVLFCARYNTFAAAQAGASLLDGAQVDVGFQQAAALQLIPHLVYALLRSPLLAVTAPSHPDLRAAVHYLWAGLPPQLLRCAIYPVLASYSDLDTQAYPQHALSRAALIAAGAPIFLLDCFTALVLYYAVGCPPQLQFPPPQSSQLRRTINSLRQKRWPTPSLKMLRGGIDTAQPFLDHLLEEPELDGNSKVVTPGLVEFLEQVKVEVWSYMANTRKR